MAKLYWIRYLPIAEMPRIACVISESYRNELITENEAMSGMVLAEKEIKKWIKENNDFAKNNIADDK